MLLNHCVTAPKSMANGTGAEIQQFETKRSSETGSSSRVGGALLRRGAPVGTVKPR